MSDDDVSYVIKELARSIRDRWDKLGFIESDGDSFATGHTPAVAPYAYLCRFYEGLSDEGLKDAEEESERYLPRPYRDFLETFNGAKIMGISLSGATGGQNHRDTGHRIGQPISVRYHNAFYLRPEYIPEGHFGLGAINGEWYSQGHLYLTSAGEVELFNRDHNLIGAKWRSLAEFLNQEIPRQMTRYDEAGKKIKGIKPLPGNTDDWEELGKEISDKRKREDSLLYRTIRKLGGFQDK